MIDHAYCVMIYHHHWIYLANKSLQKLGKLTVHKTMTYLYTVFFLYIKAFGFPQGVFWIQYIYYIQLSRKQQRAS